MSGRCSIIVVDDDANIREMIRKHIYATGADAFIVESEDGKIALEKIRNQKFDLLITDLVMPKMDGIQLLRALEKMPPDKAPTSTIVISSYLEMLKKPELQNLRFVPKPFEKKLFEITLANMLGVHDKTNDVNHLKNSVDVNFINPFIEGTLLVVQTMAKLKVQKESVFLRKDEEISGDVSASVGMTSSLFFGSMAVCFEETCYLEIVNKMFDENHTAITQELADAAGELCNQIFGHAKRVLNEQGHTIQPAIPTVINGKGHTISHPLSGKCIVVRFSTPAGKFCVEAVVKPYYV